MMDRRPETLRQMLDRRLYASAALVVTSVLLLSACKMAGSANLASQPPGEHVANVRANVQASAGIFSASLAPAGGSSAAEGLPEDGSDAAPTASFSKFDGANFSYTPLAAASVNGTQPVVVGRVNMETLVVQVNRRSQCSLVKSEQGVLSGPCTDMFPELGAVTPPTPTPEAPPPLGSESFKVSSFYDGVVCGSWYNESPIWIIRFGLRLDAASNAALAQVASVDFDVFPDYRPPNEIVRATGGAITTTRRFTTKIGSWSTTGTTVTLNSGETIRVGPARTPPDPRDPNRPLGGSCASTPQGSSPNPPAPPPAPQLP